MNILLVEDDLPTQKIISHHLTKFGHQVDVKNSVFETLADISSHDFAIIDANLPDGKGIELAQTLISKDYFAKIIISSASDSDLEKARNLGFICLAKPFTIADLKKMLVL